MSKITDEQLKTLQDYNNKRNAVFHDLGVLESQKHGLLHILAEINQLQQESNKQLEEQYGKITVNLEDGSYEEIQEEQKKIDG
jgi:hypothetical protein